MNLFYGIGMGLGWSLPRGLLLVDFSVLLWIANLAALVWHGRVLVREAAVPVPQAGDDSSAARSQPPRFAAASAGFLRWGTRAPSLTHFSAEA